MERFNIIQPSAALAPYVKHYWLLECDDVLHSQRVIPSGNIELLFHRGNPMRCSDQFIPRTSLSGQSLSFTDLMPTGTINIISVVFLPFGAKAFFGLPLCELSNLTISADDLSIGSLKELEDQILNTADDSRCIGFIESFLMSCLNPFKEYNYHRMVTAVSRINQCSDQLSVSRLADTVCLSKKQFERVFCEHVGATPKDFMRIVRFQKALYTLQNNSRMSFTSVACECVFYDQAHMTNEFKLFSGYTPSQYVAICAPCSDYFSL